MLKLFIKSKELHFTLLLSFIMMGQFGYSQKWQNLITLPFPSISGYCGELPNLELCSLPEHFVLDETGSHVHNPKLECIDRFGNVYCKKIPLKKSKVTKKKRKSIFELFGPVMPQPITPNYISPDGLFAVYLADDIQSPPPLGVGFSSNTGARNVIAQVFGDLEKLIVENMSSGTIEPVKFELKSSYFNSGVLASASSYYEYNSVPSGTIVKGDVWDAINTGSNVPDEWDGIIRVNFFHNWRTEINANLPGAGYDMYSVLLHEIIHALGFASGIGINGLPKNNLAYLTYDQLIHTTTGNALVDQNGNFDNSLLSTISTGCPTANIGTLRLGSDDRFVYSPNVFSNGSSLSHIDDGNNCTFPSTDYIMTPSIAINSSKRLHSDEFGLLCELGYTLSSSYGHPNVILFSNPATVTTASNSSNVINYLGCAPVVVGVDDFDDPSTVLTTNNCTGTTLQILESNLLSNDNSTLGSPLQVANLIALDGSTITSTGFAPNRTFTYTPSGFGSFQLRYQPVDNANNYGNYTYINISITACPDFECINTNSCNLICNSEAIDNGNCGVDDCYYFTIDNYSQDCTSPNNFHIPGWAGLFFSPDWLPNVNFSTCVVQNNISVNTNSLPNPIGGRLSFFTGQLVSSPTIRSFLSEVLSTSVNVQPNTRYLLSYHKTEGIDLINNANNGYTASKGIQVSLNIMDNNFFPAQFQHLRYTHNLTSGNVVPFDNPSVQYFDSTKFDLITDLSVDENWSQTVLNFTSPSNSMYSLLSFYGLIDQSYPNAGLPYSTSFEGYLNQLDRFELIEDHLQDIPNTYTVHCGGSTSVGIDLCTIENMQFQWWDATNNIQLTNGNTILNSLPLGTYSVLSTNTNGSIINISNIYSTINIELRRVLPSITPDSLIIYDNIPAIENVKSVIIDVLGGGTPNDATFTITENSSNCFEFAFQTSTSDNGDIHQWDYQNDGIIDATGTSTSFNFQLNGDYPVVHIISNDCGSIQDTIIVTVDCSICTWPKHYGSNSSLIEKADGVVVDISGNVFVHGIVESSVTFEGGVSVPSGVFLAKYDNCGTLLWIKDVPLYGKAKSTMKIDNLGNPILLSTSATSNLDSDITYRLTKFSNSNGNVLWSNIIEQYKHLHWPSFDIDMNTNEVYLLTSVNRYTKVRQSNGTCIIDYTAPNGPNSTFVYPKIKGHIVKFNSSGIAIWQDHMIANSGDAAFQDIVVAENINSVFIAGYVSNHPSPIGNIAFNSNSSITMFPNNSLRLFIASYTSGGTLQYANMHSSIQGHMTAIELEYSNMDNQIYLRNFNNLQLFNSVGNLISSTSINGLSGQIYYDQTNNHLVACGSNANQLKVEKYIGITNVWSYTKGSTNSRATVFQVFGDPTSDKVFMAGMYWNNDFSFSPTVTMPLAGGRDAFISKIRDLGSTVSYAKQDQSGGSTFENLDSDIIDVDVLIYPNPSKGIFDLNLVSGHTGCLVEVYNYLGQIVHKRVYDSNYFSIDLSSKPNGVYMVEIKNGEFSLSKNVIKF